MNQIPRKNIRISPALVTSKINQLDEFVLSPGVIDSAPDDPPAPAAANQILQPGDIPILMESQMSRGVRRISPAVSGVRPVRRPTNVPAPRPVAALPRLPAPPPARVSSDDLIVQLGRFGDIINILPLCLEASRQSGKPQRLMVSREYASILEGVSYVEPVIFDGDFSQLEAGIAAAKRITPNVRVAQVYAGGKVFPRSKDNYQREAWHRLGRLSRYEQLSVIFDRRNPERERALFDQYVAPVVGGPFIVVALNGVSFDFPARDRVIAALKKEFTGTAIIDIADITAARIFDILGILDLAHCLVACDSSIQHLAQASSVPVIAYRVNDSWLASSRRANHVLNRRYSDVDTAELIVAVKSCAPKTGASLIHVTPPSLMDIRDIGGDGVRREELAAESWDNEFKEYPGYLRVQIDGAKMSRSSDDLGDDRPAPYILDVLEVALKATKNLDDMILYTNSDVGVTPGTLTKIRRLCAAKGAFFGYRFSHQKADASLTYDQNVAGYWDGGLDIFGFTRRWLLTHGAKLPDMLLGRTGWDLVYRDVIKKTGGGELYGCIWHQAHESWWKKNMDSAGNRHNVEKLKKYLSENDTTRPYDR